MSHDEVLAVTLAVEVATVVFVSILFRRKGLLAITACAIGANLVSLPLAVMVCNEGAPLVAVAGAVFLTEALAFRGALGWKLHWAIPIALIANAAGTVCGGVMGV